MTKNDLARELAVSEKLHLSTAVKAVDGIVRILKESLAKGDNVYLRGFGTFEVKTTKKKKARDINKGTAVIVPAGRTVKFKLSKQLKDLMNNGTVD